MKRSKPRSKAAIAAAAAVAKANAESEATAEATAQAEAEAAGQPSGNDEQRLHPPPPHCQQRLVDHSADDTIRACTVEFLLSECEGRISEIQARDVEVGVFNCVLAVANQRRIARNWNNPRFRLLYESKARSVCANLVPQSYVGNERLLNRVNNGEFLPHEISEMHADHVFPERWREVVEAKVRRDEYLSTAKPAAMTDQFRCGRCKKRECSFMELQTRSCDEPATLFIQCLLCGHRWRVG